MIMLTNEGRGIDPQEVRGRNDLVQFLSQSLTGEYRTAVGDDEVRNTSTYLKSYLIEMDKETDSPVRAWRRLGFAAVEQLEDDSLIRVVDVKGATFFVDAKNPRFQVAHSIDRAVQTDQVIEQLTSRDASGFDRAWMPAGFLKGQGRGKLTGFTFRFEGAVPGALSGDIEEVDYETGEIRTEEITGSRTSMKISEYAKAEAEYQNLVHSSVFRGKKSLEQIEFRDSDVDEPTAYTATSVYSSGKIVAQGNWIGGHLGTVDRIASNYERVILRVERNFALGWSPVDDGYAFRGRPFEFIWPDEAEIVDLDRFVSLMFRTTKPFRLFGIPHRQSADRIDVAAIDLHSSDPVSFEITKRWMRVFLPQGSCGNVVARLYANLQHSVNSDISLANENGGDPFIDGPQ